MLMAVSQLGFAGGPDLASNLFHPSVYAEYAVGVGATSWKQLANSDPNQAAITESVPLRAPDNNLMVYGGVLGYQPSKNFAFEFSYLRFPDSTLYLSEDAYSPSTMQTETSEFAFMVKVLGQMTHRIPLFAYAAAGVQAIHRDDGDGATSLVSFPPLVIQENIWHVNPAFGFGFLYNINPHWVMDLAFRFNVGFGRSEVNPLKDYVPFLYSGTFRFGYRIIL